LMWNKKWKKWNSFMLIGGEKYKKIKKKKKKPMNSTVLFCILSNKAAMSNPRWKSGFLVLMNQGPRLVE